MTRTSIILAAALAALGACKGKDKDKGAEPAPGTAAATAGTATATAGTAAATAAGTAAAPNPTADARCETPCRFLADVALAEVASAFERTCARPWPAPAATDCDQLDYQRNCIYATAGYPFKKAQWQDAFGKASWYQRREDFKETALSPVAGNNIRDLKRQALACRGAGKPPPAIPSRFTRSEISKADEKIVVEWFAKKAKGELVLPSKLESDGEPTTPEEIKKEWFEQPSLFQLAPWTPIEYEGDGKAGAPRKISVATGVPGPDCEGEGEECEGFEWITFELDAKGKIVGLAVSAAACPLVYVEHANGALSYEGEILRNVVGARRETTQHLTLAALPACSGEVKVQLVEAKDEITYLDDVALMIDGTAIAPRACSAAAAPAYCGNDGRYATLHRGQTLALSFDVPEGAPCARPQLRADGYYVPVDPPR